MSSDSLVQHDGVSITLGPIRGTGPVEVYAAGYCGNVCGHFGTLVVDGANDSWEVTGTQAWPLPSASEGRRCAADDGHGGLPGE